MDSKKVVVVLAFDNRQTVPADISNQMMLAVQDLGWGSAGATTTTLVQATWQFPLIGSTQIIVDLQVPTGTLDSLIANKVGFAAATLDLPTALTIALTSVTVYTVAQAPTPGPPDPTAEPTNGHP